MDRQLLLLGLLRAQEMHGYQLNEFIDRQMAFCVDLKRSTAYYLLDKLCREGYVSEEAGRAGNRPERRIYRITESGELRFQALLRENLATYMPPTFPQDIGVIFQTQLPPEERRNLLDARRAALEAHKAQLMGLAAQLPHDHQPIVEHHLLHVEAELTWVDRLLRAEV
ncbi:MAG: PadR family transcriptional regulator [Oscillochloris sp.]|nr:PadR family transcriptional regulator [Oscillochloris sp.]